MTDQSFAAACDVNNIVAHYEKTGIDPFVDRKAQARYAEASTIPYEQAMRAKAEIDSAFELLPQPERLRYENDPQSWFWDTLEANAAHAASESGSEPHPAELVDDPVPQAPQDAPVDRGKKEDSPLS